MLGALTAADNSDSLEVFEEEQELTPQGYDIGVSEGIVADLSPAYDAAIQRLRAQRRGLSARERLGALLVGFGQPTRTGKWQEGASNAASVLMSQAGERRKEDEARRREIDRLTNAREIAKMRGTATTDAARIRAEAAAQNANEAANKPPALAPAAFDDLGGARNPYTGEKLAPGTAVTRRGDVVSIEELNAKYGINAGGSGAPQGGPQAAPSPRAAPANPAQENVVEIGGVKFLQHPDGTRTKLGAAPERMRPATRAEASRYGATAGQINTATGEFTPAKEAPTLAEDDKAYAALGATTAKIDRVMGDINEALGGVGFWTTAIPGAITKGIPGTPAHDLQNLIDPILANLGFDELAAMRAASPTGGALGQVAVKELDFLQSAVASLKTSQSPEQLAANLKKVREHYGRWKATVEKARREAAVKRGEAPAQGGASTASGKVPTRAEFLVAAKKANPGASEAQLNAYYTQKYGSGQ